jgi:hypothetical protein
LKPTFVLKCSLVIHKFCRRFITNTTSFVTSALAWMLLIAYNAPSFVFYNLVEIEWLEKKFCYFERWNFFMINHANYQMTGIVVFYFVPIIILVSICASLKYKRRLYLVKKTAHEIKKMKDLSSIDSVSVATVHFRKSRTFSINRNVNQSIDKSNSSDSDLRSAKAQWNCLKMIFYITIFFVLINLPFYVQLVIQKFGLLGSLEDSYTFKIIILTSVLLTFLNSPLNCFIYFRYYKRLNRNVRESFRRKRSNNVV